MMIPDQRGETYMAVEPDEAAETTLKEGRFDEVKKYPLGPGFRVHTEVFRNRRGQGPPPPRWA